VIEILDDESEVSELETTLLLQIQLRLTFSHFIHLQIPKVNNRKTIKKKEEKQVRNQRK
jgi:hypothetical protein